MASRGGLGLAVGSGALIGLTFSPYGGPVLPFLAFAPLGAGLAGAARDPGAAPLAPIAQGFAAAAVAHGIGLYWMVPALSWRTPLAVPAYLAVLALLGVLAGAACGAAVYLHVQRRWPLPVALAACWTGFEWAAARVPGASYAWLSAGSSLAWHPELAAGTELLGARLLTAWTVAAGAGAGVGAGEVAVRLRAGRGGVPRSGDRARATWHRAAASIALLALPLAYGHLRQRAFDEGAVAAKVAVVQPGREDGGLRSWLEPLRDLRAAEGFDLAVFPERYLDVPIGAEAAPGAPGRQGIGAADFADSIGAPILIGAPDRQIAPGARDTIWYNAAFLQPPGRAPASSYRKNRLVPGFEASARWPAAAFGISPRGYAPGRSTHPVTAAGRTIGAMVCYDSAYPQTARALARAGAEWLAVLSNDDWLDPERPFAVTWAYWQHAAHARLRAMENRISVVQAGATGYSFAVSPAGGGRMFALEPGMKGAAVLPVRPRAGVTLFTRTGDMLGLACFLVFAFGAAAAARPARRRPPRGGVPA